MSKRSKYAMLSKDDLLNIIERGIELSGSKRQYAKAHGISEQYLSDVLLDRRQLGPKLLEAIGYVKVVGYRRIIDP